MGNSKSNRRIASIESTQIKDLKLGLEMRHIQKYLTAQYNWAKINQLYVKYQVEDISTFNVHKYKFDMNMIQTLFAVIKSNVYETSITLIGCIKNFETEYPSYYVFDNKKIEDSATIDDHEHKHALALILLMIKIVEVLDDTKKLDNYLKLIATSHSMKGVTVSDFKVMHMALLKTLIVKYPQMIVDEETVGTVACFLGHMTSGFIFHVKQIERMSAVKTGGPGATSSVARNIHRNMRIWHTISKEIKAEALQTVDGYFKTHDRPGPQIPLFPAEDSCREVISANTSHSEKSFHINLSYICPCVKKSIPKSNQ